MVNDFSVNIYDANKAKIFLVCCVIDYNYLFVPTLVELIREWDKHGNGELVFYPMWRKLLHLAQTKGVQEAKDRHCSHIMFIEDDATKIPGDAIERLLLHDKEVVGAYAYSRHFPYQPMAYRKGKGREQERWTSQTPPRPDYIEPDQGLVRADLVSFQCTLIKMDVFKKIKKPWFFYHADRGGTDSWFSDQCMEGGVDIWCDTDLIVQHAGIDGQTAGFEIWKNQMTSHVQDNWRVSNSLPWFKLLGMSTDSIIESNYPKIEE